MISIRGETLIALREVPKHLPARPNSKRVHISACYRWVSTGVRGVVLESLKIGGTTYTSLEALERFAHALSGRAARLQAAGGECAPGRLAVQRSASRRLELELALPSGSLSPRQPSQSRSSATEQSVKR